jgi:CHRD domain
MNVKARRLLLALVLAVLVALALVGPASAARLDVANHGGRPLSTTLTGAAEVPGPGDPDGSGSATITINPGQEEVCWEISAEDITLPAAAAHIHEAPAGVAGDVVVTLSAPDASGFTSGCAIVDPELAKDILKNPEDYYVNVHTSDFPDGAIRGQLS